MKPFRIRAGRRQERAKDDAGLTLVELLVVMVISSLLLVLTFTVLITVQLQTKENLNTAQQVDQVRLGVAQIDRQVRSGNVIIDPAVDSADGSVLRVFTQTDGVRRCVQWQVAEETLRFRSWDPDWTSAADVEPWRVVAHGVVSDGSAPTTFEKVDNVTSGSEAQSVRVTLWVDTDPADKRPPAEVETVLTGRNTIYGYPVDMCDNIP